MGTKFSFALRGYYTLNQNLESSEIFYLKIINTILHNNIYIL